MELKETPFSIELSDERPLTYTDCDFSVNIVKLSLWSCVKDTVPHTKEALAPLVEMTRVYNELDKSFRGMKDVEALPKRDLYCIRDALQHYRKHRVAGDEEEVGYVKGIESRVDDLLS